MASSSANRGRPRVVLLPLPYQGHINPMLRLAAALHSRGFSITILHTETRAPDRRKLPADYSLITMPDGIPPELAASEDIAPFVFALNKNCATPFRDYLAGALREEEDEGRVACVVADVDWFAPLAATRELGVTALALMTSSAARLRVYLAYPRLCLEGYLPVQEFNSDTPVAELPPLIVRDLHRPMNMTAHFLYADLLANIIAGVRQCSGILLNTFDAIEEANVEKIRGEISLPVFPVGPLDMLSSSSSLAIESCSLLPQDRSCLDWLDTQPPGSVLYVSFGSLVSIDAHEFIEMAWGLVHSKRPFLWVVRPRLVRGCCELPAGELQEQISSRGRMVSWAPQEEILKHPAVGGFLTHCGWNSTMESMSEGVPMICKPLGSDQLGTARYVCDVWRVGVRVRVEMGNRLKRGDVQAAIERLMGEKEGQEVRERMVALRNTIAKCTSKGGSSNVALQHLVELIASSYGQP